MALTRIFLGVALLLVLVMDKKVEAMALEDFLRDTESLERTKRDAKAGRIVVKLSNPGESPEDDYPDNIPQRFVDVEAQKQENEPTEAPLEGTNAQKGTHTPLTIRDDDQHEYSNEYEESDTSPTNTPDAVSPKVAAGAVEETPLKPITKNADLSEKSRRRSGKGNSKTKTKDQRVSISKPDVMIEAERDLDPTKDAHKSSIVKNDKKHVSIPIRKGGKGSLATKPKGAQKILVPKKPLGRFLHKILELLKKIITIPLRILRRILPAKWFFAITPPLLRSMLNSVE